VSGDSGSFASTGVYVGDDGWVTCHHYGDKTPILVIDAGGASVSFSVNGRQATESAVTFARALASKAQEFADDIEKMHAARLADTANADSSGGDGTTKAAEGKAA
jgi:shikimate 5-dehydrogenase